MANNEILMIDYMFHVLLFSLWLITSILVSSPQNGVKVVQTRIPKIGCVAWQTEVKLGKFVEFISSAKGYFRETYLKT